MEIMTNAETAAEIKQIITTHEDQPGNVRIYIAGMACSGPSFGLALDEIKDGDVVYQYEGLNFIMESSIFEEFGDFAVEYLGEGYRVAPVNQPPSACGTCGGTCS